MKVANWHETLQLIFIPFTTYKKTCFTEKVGLTVVLRKAFQAQTVFGTFKKQTPDPISLAQFFSCRSEFKHTIL